MTKKKVWLPKKCSKCGRVFTPWNVPQLLCGDPCKIKKKLSIEESNEAWLTRKVKSKKTREELKNCLKNNGCRIL